MSVAKISALLYGSLALLFVPVFLIMSVVISAIPKTDAEQPPAILFAILAVVAPFVYAAMGFVIGAGAALIYNLVARWVGGLELNFEPAMPTQPALSSFPPAP
jgi:hypothetical protein